MTEEQEKILKRLKAINQGLKGLVDLALDLPNGAAGGDKAFGNELELYADSIAIRLGIVLNQLNRASIHPARADQEMGTLDHRIQELIQKLGVQEEL